VEGPLFGSGKHISTARRSKIQLQNMVIAAGPFPIPTSHKQLSERSHRKPVMLSANHYDLTLWSILAYGNWLGEGTQLAKASRLKFECSNWLMMFDAQGIH